MPAFPGVDFLDFDSLLNDEELLARRTARQFVDEQVLPIIEKHNREATFPLQLVPQLAELEPLGLATKGQGTLMLTDTGLEYSDAIGPAGLAGSAPQFPAAMHGACTKQCCKTRRDARNAEIVYAVKSRRRLVRRSQSASNRKR